MYALPNSAHLFGMPARSWQLCQNVTRPASVNDSDVNNETTFASLCGNTSCFDEEIEKIFVHFRFYAYLLKMKVIHECCLLQLSAVVI